MRHGLLFSSEPWIFDIRRRWMTFLKSLAASLVAAAAYACLRMTEEVQSTAVMVVVAAVVAVAQMVLEQFAFRFAGISTEPVGMVLGSFESPASETVPLPAPPWMPYHPAARHLVFWRRSFPDLDPRNPGYVVVVWEETRTWEGTGMPNTECRQWHSANLNRGRISPDLTFHGARRV